MKQHSRPLWLAVLVSPWVAPFIFPLYFVCHDLMHYHSLAFRDWGAVLYSSFVLILPGSYAATCLLALPYVLWLRMHRALSFPSVCAGAVMAGLAMSLVYASLLAGSVSPPGTVLIRFGVAIGLLSGLAFCLIAGVRLRQLRLLD